MRLKKWLTKREKKIVNNKKNNRIKNEFNWFGVT